MDRLVRSRVFIRLVALLFALLLFWNANSETKVTKEQGIPNISAVADEVPIHFVFDDKKYYISGFDPTTTVYLKSNNKVLLDSETNEKTRSFTVSADLSKYTEGTYDVPLVIENMSGSVKGELKSPSIKVTIEKRATDYFKVVPEINDNLLKQGYTLGSISTEPKQVEITAGEKTLAKIDKVAAVLGDVRNLTADMTKEVDLVALDKDANALGVIINPTTVSVQVSVTVPSRSVPLEVKQSGAIANGIKSFEFEPEMDNIVISGPREAIDKVKQIELDIDTTGITETENESYEIPVPEGINIDPNIVQVKVTPVKKDKK